MVEASGLSAEDVLARVENLVHGGRRVLLGITGPPGAGKTTFADALADRLQQRPPVGLDAGWVVRVPMDGFHLADRELARLGRMDRKGAPDTFDVAGYVALLARLTEDRDEVVYAPSFERDLEQPVAGSIPVPPSARLVITEGNYLLLAEGDWSRVHPHLDEVWYLELDDVERRRRLIARHEQFGKPGPAAVAWVDGSDQRNAELVGPTASRADLRVPSDVLDQPGRS
ncbi:MAG: Uridine kinase family protein YggC homolog [uncultured Friedmanniella sp.]|uniref:Uridine kinase family protein YggC homolog n=1 Tax=uncultured Friedmanniella sp. TaxID=335381 RepID=A0A6J4JXP9_9ACTN|nr:nucleoside/nucleotide kinase family protein [uncultured Friedmanniella sp.]CAA9290274.1 MAG: Uridine kinase family protein YggC homolog [uncultured Friedmanniella sp.]